LLLDKTAVAVSEQSQAVAFTALGGTSRHQLAEAARLASLADATPLGRSIAALAKKEVGPAGEITRTPPEALDQERFIPYKAETQMSGVDLPGMSIRMGTLEAITAYVRAGGRHVPPELSRVVGSMVGQGCTPLIIAVNGRAAGVIHLKSSIKEDVKERLSLLRGMGTTVILTTNDPPLPAAAIAAEVGMDDFLPRSTPEARLKLIRRYQIAGYRVAVTGSGSDDAAVLDRADLSVALDTGAQLTHRVAAMVDLDSNPAKLIDIVAISKQWLLARRALTAFSVVADVIKQFVLIPAVFFSTCPALDMLDFMRIPSPTSAILSAIIFNTLLITALAPIAWRAFSHRPLSPAHIPRDIPLVYGLCGLIAPVIGISLIGLILARLG